MMYTVSSMEAKQKDLYRMIAPSRLAKQPYYKLKAALCLMDDIRGLLNAGYRCEDIRCWLASEHNLHISLVTMYRVAAIAKGRRAISRNKKTSERAAGSVFDLHQNITVMENSKKDSEVSTGNFHKNSTNTSRNNQVPDDNKSSVNSTISLRSISGRGEVDGDVIWAAATSKSVDTVKEILGKKERT